MSVLETALKVKEAACEINRAGSLEKNKILFKIKQILIENKSLILAENALDIDQAKKKGLSKNLIDRLKLNSSRIEEIAVSIDQIISLPNPIGEVVGGKVLANGLKIEQVRVALGVVGIIYEARPNVTVDAATLCIKSGNAVLLKGGSDAFKTNKVLVNLMKQAVEESGFNSNIIGFVESTSRESTFEMMGLHGVLDVFIPRGGAGLIKTVVENAKVAVIETGTGNCHVYVDEFADLDMSLRIIKNAKLSKPSVCNAAESLVIHEKVAEIFLKKLKVDFDEHGVEMVGCSRTLKILPDLALATDADFAAEFLDYKISVKIVSSLNEAICHINKFSTKHSETIVTENFNAAQKFLNEIDSAVVYVNASTRFTDGFEFGLGAEIGISTQKLHARGPMGLRALTTLKFVVLGQGQVR